jgi:hypothetical protein
VYDKGWPAAMESFVRQLDVLEHALDDDAWEEPPAMTQMAAEGELPAELIPAAHELVERIAQLEQRIVGELADTRAALLELEVRRRAARNFMGRGPAEAPPRAPRDRRTQSDRSPLAQPRADD